MITTRIVSPLIAKELRELGPLWLLAAAVMALGPPGIAGPAFAVFAVACGAMVYGHEYRRGTLDMLLAQPISRGRVLAVKLSLLAGLLGLLLGVSWLRDADGLRWSFLLMSLACALCLAPPLTVVCRSEVAGLVFASAAPMVLWMGAQIIAILRYGMSPNRAAEIAALQWSIFLPGFIAICALGAIGGVRAVLRVESGAAATLRFGRSRRREGQRDRAVYTRTRRRSPYVLLVLKELRLLPLPLSIACLFTLLWVSLTLAAPTFDTVIDLDSLRGGLSNIYTLVVVVLVGSVVSAEERQFGVLPTQVLLPVAAWQQWTVKLVTGLACVWLLAIALPWVLNSISPIPGAFTGRVLRGLPQVAASAVVLMLFVVSVYVSSLVGGALRAVLTAVGVIVFAGYLGLATLFSVGTWSATQIARMAEGAEWVKWLDVDQTTYFAIWNAGPVVFLIPLIPLLLVYAFKNHRTLERPCVSLERQVPRLLCASLCAVLVFAVGMGTLSVAFDAKMRANQAEMAEMRRRLAPARPATSAPVPPR